MTNTMGPVPTTQSGAVNGAQSYPAQTYPAPTYPTPTYPAPSHPGQTPYPQRSATDPGRTLGIVGLILSPFAGLLGLILSLVALRKSKRAGFANRPALIGAIVGALATVGVLVAIVVGSLAIGGVVDTCRDLGPGQHVVNGVTYTCG